MIRLGVNIDHVATVRQARRTVEPDPVQAAVLVELGGADGITVHLREDRRHIQDRDVLLLRQTLRSTLNLEMGLCDEILAIALDLHPQHVCLVPERRQELTTEGGLRLDPDDARLREAIAALQANGTCVSLFIDPDPTTIRHAATLGARCIELHTGAWAEAWLAAHQAGGASDRSSVEHELYRLEHAAWVAAESGLICNAGHGITYQNVRELLHLQGLNELNIGHSIVARALFTGLREAVTTMKGLIEAGPIRA
jgi:pyridoxine 5-phosphate synthase